MDAQDQVELRTFDEAVVLLQQWIRAYRLLEIDYSDLWYRLENAQAMNEHHDFFHEMLLKHLKAGDHSFVVELLEVLAVPRNKFA